MRGGGGERVAVVGGGRGGVAADGDGDGGGDLVRTVECLRGRLLAERVASKAAKKEAEQFAEKLGELERKLAKENKSMNKAERRLNLLLSKLESSKILQLTESSSGSLSSNGFLGDRASEERKTSSLSSGSLQCDSTTSSVNEPEEVSPRLEASGECSCSSVTSLQSRINGEEYAGADVATIADVPSQQPVCSREQETDDFVDHEDNKLALVLVDTVPKSQSDEIQIHDAMQAALLALKQAKEQLQQSLTRRSYPLSGKERAVWPVISTQ